MWTEESFHSEVKGETRHRMAKTEQGKEDIHTGSGYHRVSEPEQSEKGISTK
jgi:hypothetical protein